MRHLATPINAIESSKHIFGAAVVEEIFINALFQDAHCAGGTIVYRVGDERHRDDALARARATSSVPWTSASLDALAQGREPLTADIWHDVRPRDGHRLALRLRERSGRMYPVTFTHHTISYPEHMLELFAPLLLSGFRACDALVCTSTASRDVIARILSALAERLACACGNRHAFEGRLPVIPLGVDVQRFRPREQADAREQVGLPRDARIALWVGRLDPRSKADILPLLRAAARVAEAEPRLLLVLATTSAEDYGPLLRDTARELGIAERLVIDDRAHAHYAHLWYAAADVFVSPADNVQETFGLTPIEAMACGVPQVVADWNGYRDTVEDGVTGIRVPTLWHATDGAIDDLALIGDYKNLVHATLAQSTAVDEEALTLALRLLLTNEPARRAMGEASRKRAVAEYAWPRVIARYQSLWEELAAEASRIEASPRRDFSAPAYKEFFRGYPTGILDGSSTLVLTPAGSRLARGQARLPMHGIPPLLDAAFARTLCAYVEAMAAEGAVTFERLAVELASTELPDADWTARHVMWLVKHSFIAASPLRPD